MLVAALSALLLIVVTSLLTYELLRAAWRFMVASPFRHGRVLYALAAAFIAHFVSIALYGLVYYALAGDGLGTLHQTAIEPSDPVTVWLALYYSAATYSTLGFGDVVPRGALRLVSVIEGVNGLMLIGWSVAHSFLAMEEFWDKPQPPAAGAR